MKNLKFFACAFASLYCVFFMVSLAISVPKVDLFFWYLEFLCFVAAIVYGILAYNRRPWANPWS